MRRRTDWEERLEEALRSVQYAEFQYGLHDCCLMVAYVLDRICEGTAFATYVRQHFPCKSERDAAEHILRGGGLRQLVDDALGEHESPALARRGDVALVSTEDHREALGVVLGDWIAVANAGRGFALFSRARALACWRID